MYTARITVTIKKTILDPQGKTIEHSLQSIGFKNISGTRMGKYIKMNIDAASEKEAAAIAEDACRKLLANPVMEDYSFIIEKTEKK